MFFIEWWNSLGLASQIFACIAIPTTLLLFIQTVMMFIGFGEDSPSDSDADLDVSDGDVSADGDLPEIDDVSGLDGLRVFTVRGIIAFFVVFGWVGVVLDNSGLPLGATIPIALASGVLMMFVLAYLTKGVLKLKSDGTADNKNALGVAGRVQLTVPPSRSGAGKVHIILQGTYSERDAVTDEDTPIPTGSEIVVIGLSGKTTLVVKRK
jgi:membrane protein implicated in regulation of membrane protease activity